MVLFGKLHARDSSAVVITMTGHANLSVWNVGTDAQVQSSGPLALRASKLRSVTNHCSHPTADAKA